MLASALFVFGMALLAWARRLHVRQRAADNQAQWTGVAFDTSVIAVRIRNVRENYIAQLAARDASYAFHDQLLACAREAVKSFNYFKGRTMIESLPRTGNTDG